MTASLTANALIEATALYGLPQGQGQAQGTRECGCKLRVIDAFYFDGEGCLHPLSPALRHLLMKSIRLA